MPNIFPDRVTNPVQNGDVFVFCGVDHLKRATAKAITFTWTCSMESTVATPYTFAYQYLTADGGQTWHSWLTTGNEDFADGTTGWRMNTPGDGQPNALQQSLDGGQTWSTIKYVDWPIVHFDFINDWTGWATVTEGSGLYALLRTVNGGWTWSALQPRAGYYQAPKLVGTTPTPLSAKASAAINPGNAGQVVELGRKNGVIACPGSWSPNGSEMAAVGNVDGYVDVNVYDSASLNSMPYIDVISCSFAFSPDWSIVAVQSKPGIVYIRHMADGTLLHILILDTTVNTLTFSPDNSLLAVGAADGSTSLWQVSNGLLLHTLESDRSRQANLAFSPDGKTLASATGTTVTLWDTSSGQELAVLQGHTWAVNVLAFSPDGTQLASGSGDGTVRLWQIPNGKPLDVMQAGTEVKSVAFSPDGSLIASGELDGSIKVWDRSTGQLLATLIGHSDYVAGVAFSPDGKRVLSTSADSTLRLWGIVTANP